MKRIYQVVVVSSGHNVDSDGNLYETTDRECEHNHRTISGAYRCLRSRVRTSDGLDPLWFNAEIRAVGKDGRATMHLTPDESFDLAMKDTERD